MFLRHIVFLITVTVKGYRQNRQQLFFSGVPKIQGIPTINVAIKLSILC